MEIIVPVAILLFSAILHEVMHGFIANRLGDPTARIMGRLTLNPIPHIDPVMSILVPLMLYISTGGQFIFGAAKPVPIDPRNFKDPKKDMALSALAGPFTNFLIAFIAAFLIRFVFKNDVASSFLYLVVYYNLILGIINLMPIPPLDGSKVLAGLMPNDLARAYLSIEQYGIFILFFLLLFPIGGFSLGNLINQLMIFSMRLLGM